jgi:murein L,D-transpeptidase YafK
MWHTRWGMAIVDGTLLLMLGILLAMERPRFTMAFNQPLPDLSNPRIVVIKSQNLLTVYDGRRVAKRYHVISGRNAGDKVKEGDARTPVGEFYVCYKNPQSKYTLSIGLSYPNKEDADRGLRDGLITQAEYDTILSAMSTNDIERWWHTPLGGEIMIHGAKNDRSGTAGCVAMSDDDIRELYPKIPEGTAVEIRE